MTQIGAGGVVITRWSKLIRFHRDYDKLTIEQRDRIDQKLQDLSMNPRPPGLGFEKLKGYDNPPVYTIHVRLYQSFSLAANLPGLTHQSLRTHHRWT